MYKIVSLLNSGLTPAALQGLADGVILGSLFSRYDDLSLYQEARKNGLQVYISIDQMIYEEDLELLRSYLSVIKTKEIAGVYFSDLAVLNEAKALGMQDMLIYDPLTLLTNSLDTVFFLKQGVQSCVLARELTLEEITEICKNAAGKVDLQLFGPLIMAVSRRKYLRSYFDYAGIDEDPKAEGGYLLQELSRREYYRITENEKESIVYTKDFAAPYKEYLQLQPLCQRVILCGDHVKGELLLRVLQDLQDLTAENAEEKRRRLQEDFPQESFNDAYLYRRTNLRK